MHKPNCLFLVFFFLLGWTYYTPCLNLGIPKDAESRILGIHPSEETSIFQIDLSAFKGATLPFYTKLIEMNVDIFAMHPTTATIHTQPAIMRVLMETFSPISFKTVVANVSDFLNTEMNRLKRTMDSPLESIDHPMDWFKRYHPLNKIESFYIELQNNYPDRVRILPAIGFSYEGRSIMAVSITGGQNATSLRESQTRPQFFIQGGIHAREWISHATLQYISYHLASSVDPAIVSLLNEGEFLIIPVLNPDGYAYTWEKNRLWRKNRRVNSDQSYGVDLNRNFDARWGHEGTSRVPSSETYCGKRAASEPEVQAVTQFFESHNRIIMALDLHSYSQLILRPVGWTNKDAPHEKKLKKIGKKMAKIIHDVHGMVYVSEKSVSLYPTTGAAHDWFYMQKKTMIVSNHSHAVHPYGLTIELRPTAEWFGPGFLLDPTEIIPTGEEILPAILHLANYSLHHPLYAKGSKDETLFNFSFLSIYLLFLCAYFVFWTFRKCVFLNKRASDQKDSSKDSKVSI